MIRASKQKLEALKHRNGLYSASAVTVSTGYDKAWIRDNLYIALGVEAVSPEESVKTYHALLNILKKHEYKIDHAISEKPKHSFQYIHARYCPATLREFNEEWGNKQNDAVGFLLFKIGDLAEKGYKVIRDVSDLRVLKKLVDYAASIEYWHDEDNGVWEESEELHASSVGAMLAGLKKISQFIYVNPELITKGEEALENLLPRESKMHETDLAQLSLIYPFDVVTPEQRDIILANIEEKLVREKGVIRYEGDRYYNRAGEAEWTMGFPWLAIIYAIKGDYMKYRYYLQKTFSAMNEKGELPELYFAGTCEHNENSPLGWSQSLFMTALGVAR